MTADNAAANDTQVEALAGMRNSFEPEGRVRCFNHTLQLSAKTLLRPFNAGLGKATEGGSEDNKEGENFLDIEEDSEDSEDDDDEDALDGPNADDVDDGIDELDDLGADAREKLMADTTAVRQVISKVCDSFY